MNKALTIKIHLTRSVAIEPY